MWKFERDTEFDRQLRKWPKKHKRELLAMIDNLDTLAEALNGGLRIEQAKRHFRFVHGNYSLGFISIDQRGPGSGKKQTRLYAYADEDNEVLHQLTLGDKDSQKHNVAFCKDWVERFLKTTQNEGEPHD